MATIRLIPSTYQLSNTSYLSVSDANNMYANTDSTTYATITHNRASTSNTYYAYVRGFNFNDVPSNAIINSFTVKIKASATGHTTSTSSSYYMSLTNGTTQIDSTSASGRLSTTVTIFTFANGSLTWDMIVGYDSNFGIRIPLRRASSNTTDVVSVYGAEIEVNYTIPIYHNITATSNSQTVTISPSAQTISESENTTVTLTNVSDISTITVKDNNIDVTNQLLQQTSNTTICIPNGNTNNGFTLSNIENAYSNAASDDYASLQLGGGSTGTIYLNINVSLPDNIVLQGVVPKVTLQYNRNNSSSSYEAECQMYAGSTYKGQTTTIVSDGSSDMPKSTFTLNSGTWTLSELQNARLYISATNGARSTQRYLYVYGVSLEITYESDGKTYTYTISNVQTDHTIVVEDASSSSKKSYVKKNNTFIESTNQYVKESNSWINRTISKIFWKINGSWTETNDSMSGKTAFKIDV